MTADLLVDLSNVCRDKKLGGPELASWNRYARVMQAWREQINPASVVLAVADSNLIRKFGTMKDKAAYTAAEGRGEVISAPDADPVILEQAQRTGAAVLSRDGYVGHRRRHDWIQGDAEHFWSWSAAADGNIRIVRRDMDFKGPYTVTRAAESDERKEKNLRDTDATPLLARFWRCRNSACARSSEDPLRDPPALYYGSVQCPSCRHAVEDAGARPAGRGFKVLAEDTDEIRFSLLDGQMLILGRLEGDRRLNLAGLSESAGKLSRDHARIELRGGQAVATDLGSGNGTVLQRWDSNRRSWGPVRALKPHVAVTLLPRDRIVLAGIVRIEQSGRDYVVAQDPN